MNTEQNTRPASTLNENERRWLDHMIRWGSDGYPIQKVSGGRWIWNDAFGCKGAPTVYKTKRAVVAACAAYEEVLIDKSAGRY